MRSVTFLPRPALRPYVQLLWGFEADGPPTVAPERIVPDGIVEWVVHFRGATTARFAEEPFSPLPGSALVCQGTRYLDVRPGASVGFVSVRFYPWGAMHFFDLPVDELSNRIVPAESVWPREGAALAERVAEAPRLRERAELIESYLLERLGRFRKRDVQEAVSAVWRTGGSSRVPALCQELGVSERTALRIFRRSVGMPPKRYARLVRFLTACSMIRRTEWLSLGEIGYRCGYYDQAHFDADFKSFSGMSPSEFVVSMRVSFLEIG